MSIMSGDKNYTRPLVITSEIKKKTSYSSQSTHPVGRVLLEKLLEGEGEKSESKTSIFCVLTVKSCCQYMGCSNETDWVNIILAVM